MVKINIHEAKTHLSRYLAKLKTGERIVLCRRNVPVAETLPLPSRRREPRPLDLAKGKVQMPPEFFDPLPADLLDALGGTGETASRHV